MAWGGREESYYFIKGPTREISVSRVINHKDSWRKCAPGKSFELGKWGAQEEQGAPVTVGQ